ncbi:MAG: hypothetical protein AAF639_35030 [Chloroflexota bacterium]
MYKSKGNFKNLVLEKIGTINTARLVKEFKLNNRTVARLLKNQDVKEKSAIAAADRLGLEVNEIFEPA